jgi:hypothetical protein
MELSNTSCCFPPLQNPTQISQQDLLDKVYERESWKTKKMIFISKELRTLEQQQWRGSGS